MKKMLVLLTLSLFSFSQADIPPKPKPKPPVSKKLASNQEKKLLCKNVDNYLEAMEFDGAMDLTTCLNSKSIKSYTADTEGSIIVEGLITVKTVSGYKSTSFCTIGYKNKPTQKNVIEGVSCQAK